MTDIITIPEIHAGLPALTAGIASGMYSIRLYLRIPAGWVCETGEMPRTEHMPFMRLHMRKGVYYRMGIICGAVVFLYLIRHIFCFCFFPASAVCIILALIALSACRRGRQYLFHSSGSADCVYSGRRNFFRIFLRPCTPFFAGDIASVSHTAGSVFLPGFPMQNFLRFSDRFSIFLFFQLCCRSLAELSDHTFLCGSLTFHQRASGDRSRGY